MLYTNLLIKPVGNASIFNTTLKLRRKRCAFVMRKNGLVIIPNMPIRNPNKPFTHQQRFLFR